MKHIYSFLALSLILFATSCTKLNLDEATKMGYDASLGVPVCKFHSSIIEILSKADTAGYVYVNPENQSLHVYWEEKQQNITFDFINLYNGDTVAQSFDITTNPKIQAILDQFPQIDIVPLPADTFSFTDEMLYTFSFNKYEAGVKEYAIDSITIARAVIDFAFNLRGLSLGKNSRIELSIEMPTIKNYKQNKINAVISKEQMHISRLFPDFTADFTNQVDGQNDLKLIFNYKIVSDGTATISRDAAIDYAANFHDIIYDVAYGRIWDSKAVYDTIVGIKLPDALRNIANGDNQLLFHDPELTLYLVHDVGIDVRYVIDSIFTLDKDGKILKCADFGGSPTLSNYLHRPYYPRDLAYDTICLNREHGKTNELFSIMPDSMALKCHVYVGKQNGTHKDFIVNPMKLLVDLDAHMEMSLDPGSHYSSSDTINADLASVDKKFLDYVNIDEFYVILLTKSSLPVNATGDFIMLDEYGKELYRLMGFKIECPPVDEHGVAETTTNQEIRLAFQGDDIQAILKTKKILFKVYVDGKDAQSMISIHADNAVDIDVSAYAKFKANLDNILK